MSWPRQRRNKRWGWPLFLLALVAAWAWWYWWPDTLPEALRRELPMAESSPAHNPVLYKWKDAKGQWQVTDQPPAEGPYEEIQVDQDTNVLPAGVAPEPD